MNPCGFVDSKDERDFMNPMLKAELLVVDTWRLFFYCSPVRGRKDECLMRGSSVVSSAIRQDRPVIWTDNHYLMRLRAP